MKLKNDQGRGTSSAELRSTGPKQRPDKGSDESLASEERVSDVMSPNDDMERRDYLKFLRRFLKVTIPDLMSEIKYYIKNFLTRYILSLNQQVVV